MTEAQAIPDHFVFLDRDGVINLDFGEYTTTIDEWKWAPGTVEGIKMLNDAGFGIIVITNQACIAKGIQTEEGLAQLHTFMLNHIRESGGNILRIYHCPHQTTDGCSCRKPEPGMILQAAKDYSIDLSKTFFIGDAPRDVEAARRAGARSILINNVSGKDSFKIDSLPVEFRAKNLLDAAEIVIRESGIEL